MIPSSSNNDEERNPVQWLMPRRSCMVYMLFQVTTEESTSVNWSWEVVTENSDMEV